MKKKTILFGILAIVLMFTTVAFRLYNWQGNDRIFTLSIIIISLIGIIISIRSKGNKFKTTILVLGTLGLLIIGTGTIFKLLNWSNTYFWPVNNYYSSLSYIVTEEEPYKWHYSKNDSLTIIAENIENQLSVKPFMRSLLIVHNDSLVIEKYYNGCNKYYAFNIASCTKSITSALVGIAIDKGLIESEKDNLSEYIPEYYSGDIDENKRKINLGHLLTMQAGWTFGKQNAQNLSGFDWIKSSMNNPLEFEPGKAFSYNNIEPHILLQIIDNKSKSGVIDFATKYLCDPLDISITHWAKNQAGQHFGGGAIFMTPRDMARFGQLYLKEGRIDDNQVIAKSWIEKSQLDYVANNLMPQRTPAKGYGFLWWVDNHNENVILQAAGSGGQHIFVIPKLEMIIVTTAEINVPPRLTFENSLQIIDVINGIIYKLLDKK